MDIETVIAAGVGAGVVPPPPLPLLETPPEQPEASDMADKAMRVATSIEQRANPVQDRFTVKSPKTDYFIFS
jgi:hypothetical protein